MSRGTLPSYERLAHVPNILEAYRYLTRRNLTTLCSELAMSYHTVRRLCTQWAAPRENTLKQIEETLSFVTKDNWDHWHSLCNNAQEAERTRDIVLITAIEEKLRQLLPVDGLVDPLHIMHPCSLQAAAQMHNAAMSNKPQSFYLSDLHGQALDLLSVKLGVTKSEMIRLFIDTAMQEHTDVLEALVRNVTGQAVEVVVPKPPEPEPDPDIIEISDKESLAKLIVNIPVDEVLHQLTTELPEDVATDETSDETAETTTDLFEEPLDYSAEDTPIEIEEWRPNVTMSDDSNLTEDEIARLFSGED